MRKMVRWLVLGLLLAAATDAAARTVILSHVVENDSQVPTAGAFDTQLFLTYVGGLPGAPARTGQTAEVAVYLYDEATGGPLQSALAQDVCNPCVFALGAAAPAQRKRTVTLHEEIVARGGFAGPFQTGFVIAVVTGDETNVSVVGAIVNSRTGPDDLVIVPLEPQPIGATSIGGGGR
jgi:hypothetical protein